MQTVFHHFHTQLHPDLYKMRNHQKTELTTQKADTEPTMLMKRTQDILGVLRELVGAAERRQSNFMDTTGF